MIINLVLATGIRSRNFRKVKINNLDIGNGIHTKDHKLQTIYLSKRIINILVG